MLQESSFDCCRKLLLIYMPRHRIRNPFCCLSSAPPTHKPTPTHWNMDRAACAQCHKRAGGGCGRSGGTPMRADYPRGGRGTAPLPRHKQSTSM
eukprot:2526758-Amphidinium_carterae.1